MAGSATLTTVLSMKAMLEPRMVTARIHGPADFAQGATARPDSITVWLQGGFMTRFEMLALEFSQSAVNHVDGDGSFTNGGGDAFHVAGTNIADRKDAGKTGFEHLRRSDCQSGPVGFCDDVAAREDETLAIEGHAVLQPIRARRRAGHNEYMANVMHGSLAGGFVLPSDSLEMRIAL